MDYTGCELCPNMCRIDRTRGEKGVCLMSDRVKVAWSGLHKGEEPPLVGKYGSGMIFFTGCPLHCAYCQNRQISGSDGMNIGYEVSSDELSEMMLSLEEMKASSINLVTGTHFIPSIKDAIIKAKEKRISLPIVWNSSGYERVEALNEIDDLIDVYLLDCKSLSRKVCSLFCGSKKYADVIIPVMDYIKERHPVTDLDKMSGTILRHLVFPGTIEATKNFLRYFASHYKNNFYLSLMVQFVPPLKNVDFPKMTDDEYDELVELLEELEIDDGFMQDRGDEILWIPDFTKDVPFPPSFASVNPYFLSLKGRL